MCKKIIFDTDLGSDCDDMMAITYLAYAEKYLNAEVIAVTHALKCEYGVPAIKSFYNFFSMKNRPVGYMVGGADLTDQYAQKLAEKFASESDYKADGTAVEVLRKALYNSKEKCVICAVGQFTNIGALLESKADEICSLSGIELVKLKCEKIVLMAGMFYDDANGTRPKEWNVKWDVPAFKRVVTDSPVPVAFLPSEMGIRCITGRKLQDKYGDSNPLSYSFNVYQNAINGRASWDPITAVYAVEGVKNFLTESYGDVTVDDEGRTYFTKNEKGNHILLHYNYSNFKTEYDVCNAFASYIDNCAEKFIDGTV